MTLRERIELIRKGFDVYDGSETRPGPDDCDRLLLALDTLEAVEKNCSGASVAAFASEIRETTEFDMAITEAESWADWLDGIAAVFQKMETKEDGK